MRLLFAICVAGITYGSLFPFQFLAGWPDGVEFGRFFARWAEIPSRGDVFGNLFLFLPFGLIGSFLMDRKPLALGGLLFSAALQIAQFWVIYRDPQIQDIFWNMAGLAAGMGLAAIPAVEHAFRNAEKSRWLTPPVLIIGIWFLAVAVPFAPSLDFSEFKKSLKPLLKNPVFESAATFRVFVAWIAVACMLQQVFVERWRQQITFLAVIGLALFLKVLILRNTVDLADALGALVAAALWFTVLERLPGRGFVAGTLALAAIVWSGLEPFRWRPEPIDFRWWPFEGALYGSLLIATKAMLTKLFFYSAAIWLLSRGRVGIVAITIIVALVALAVEVVQIWIAGHIPEITDALVALGIGLLLAYRQRGLRGSTTA